MDKKLLDMLVCPVCKGSLDYHKTPEELHCPRCHLAFPVKDGMPIMLEEEARPLKAE
jgi:uncharacterized protein YbaR (Trm112 family)